MSANRPGKFLRVLYDYRYSADDGSPVSIKKGENCLLLKKTTDEWWSVLRTDDKKQIYVPANYVKEVTDPTDKEKAMLASENLTSNHTSQDGLEDPIYDNALDAFPKTTNKKPPPVPVKRVPQERVPQDSSSSQTVPAQNPEPSCSNHSVGVSPEQCIDLIDKVLADELGDSEEDHKDAGASSTEPAAAEDKETTSNADADSVNMYEEPEYVNLQEVQAHIHSRSDSPQQENKTGEGRIYANLDEIRPKVPSSSSSSREAPLPDADAQPLRVLGQGWELHEEPTKKRKYYYNRETNESSWTAPRLHVKKGSESNTDRGKRALSTFGKSLSSSCVLEASTVEVKTEPAKPEDERSRTPEELEPENVPQVKVPPGWIEKIQENGARIFVHPATEEKWYCSLDRSGRKYFYKDGSKESVWKLPEVRGERLMSVDSALAAVPQIQRSESPKPAEEEVKKTSSLPRKLESPSTPEDKSQEMGSRENLNSQEVFHKRNPSNRFSAMPSIDVTTKVALSDLFPKPYTIQNLERRGFLNKTKLSEAGKRIKKNWVNAYVVFAGATLYFYKDQKSANKKPNSSVGKPEEVLDLHGAMAQWASSETSSRKNVLQLTLMNNTQYLLQSDDVAKMKCWHDEMVYSINRQPLKIRRQNSLPSTESADSDKSFDRSLEEEQLSPNSTAQNRKPSKKKREKGSSSEEVTSPSGDKTKIRRGLIQFLLGRPAKEALEKKGIIKDVVFGSTISAICEKEGTTVPKFVPKCIAAIEEKGLDMDGIYRISGNLAEIQKLRFLIEKGERWELKPGDWDIHVLTGALKLFFRELKDPLFPTVSYAKFVRAVAQKDKSTKLKEFKDLIKSLPKPNRETMKELFNHLNRVMDQSKENRMQSQNIAIVFGPTLMWTQSEAHNVAINMVLQNQIVEFILLHQAQIFK